MRAFARDNSGSPGQQDYCPTLNLKTPTQSQTFMTIWALSFDWWSFFLEVNYFLGSGEYKLTEHRKHHNIAIFKINVMPSPLRRLRLSGVWNTWASVYQLWRQPHERAIRRNPRTSLFFKAGRNSFDHWVKNNGTNFCLLFPTRIA